MVRFFFFLQDGWKLAFVLIVNLAFIENGSFILLILFYFFQ